MGGEVDLVNDEIAVFLVNTDLYTVDLDADETLGDIPQAALVAEALLTGKTLDGSTFRADSAVLEAVEGDQVGALIIFKDTGDYNTSYLIFYGDNAPELPITPDGSDVTIAWDLGADGIFKL